MDTPFGHLLYIDMCERKAWVVDGVKRSMHHVGTLI